MGAETRLVTPGTAAEIALWCGGRLVEQFDGMDSSIQRDPGINVPVGDEGEAKRAQCGDTVIRKHDGTFDVIR